MEPLITNKEGGVFFITLNRPDFLNAINRDLLSALSSALHEADAPDVRAVVIKGMGRAFCAGQDLKEASAGKLDYEKHLELYNEVFLQIRRLEKPVIAGVHGVAAGAGMSLALAADLRLLSYSASFITAFARIGLAPDTGITATLPRLVGMGKAFELLALSPEINAVQALELGLANRLVSDDEFEETLIRWSTEIANGPTLVYGLVKRALNSNRATTLEEAVALEAELQGIAGGSRDHQEGLAAFLGGRKPRFQGR